MKSTILFLFILFLNVSFAQEQSKAIILHPAVGKLIDQQEKKIYQLFPEYKDSAFVNAFILKYNDSTYTVVINAIKNKAIERNLSREDLDKMYYQIDEIYKTNPPKSNSLLNEEKNRKKRKKANKSE